MTYTAETRPETSERKRIMKTAEMWVLRKIVGKPLRTRAKTWEEKMDWELRGREARCQRLNSWLV